MTKLFALFAAFAILSSPLSTSAYTEPDSDAMVVQSSTTAGNIVEVAVADGRFTTLVTAVQAAGLVGTLTSDGPFTVFAPTDAAFSALPAGTIDALLADIPSLTSILLYHVVPGAIPAADVVNLMAAQTAGGQSVTISASASGVMINGSHVIITDVMASNGVIHVIDAVMIPTAQ